jgi:hypothetical protein
MAGRLLPQAAFGRNWRRQTWTARALILDARCRSTVDRDAGFGRFRNNERLQSLTDDPFLIRCRMAEWP